MNTATLATTYITEAGLNARTDYDGKRRTDTRASTSIKAARPNTGSLWRWRNQTHVLQRFNESSRAQSLCELSSCKLVATQIEQPYPAKSPLDHTGDDQRQAPQMRTTATERLRQWGRYPIPKLGSERQVICLTLAFVRSGSLTWLGDHGSLLSYQPSKSKPITRDLSDQGLDLA